MKLGELKGFQENTQKMIQRKYSSTGSGYIDGLQEISDLELVADVEKLADRIYVICVAKNNPHNNMTSPMAEFVAKRLTEDLSWLSLKGKSCE